MSGSTTALELDGPAELLRRTSIHRIDGGGHQKVGAMEEEFEVLLTGTGKVVVRLSTKFPTSDYPEVTEHVIGVS